MSTTSQRADRFLVDAGLFESRTAARAAIDAGLVRADGVLVTRASQKIAPGTRIDAAPAHPYVSRGGLKLAHALDVFGVAVEGRACLDLGASTGGFTDVLLRRGAVHVTAVDVGTGQLHGRLRADGRVRSLEQTDVRSLAAVQMLHAPDLVVGDLSFIALEKALAVPLGLASPDADLVLLFKPQFQVGKAHVGKGGLVTDTGAVARSVSAFTAWMADQGWTILAWAESPILGGDGNSERLLHARRRS